MGRLIDLTGRRYGRLLVLSKAARERSPAGRSVPLWNCVCDCGEPILVRGESLRTLNTQSCGCMRLEAARLLGLVTKPVVGYTAAHLRVRMVLGPARLRSCVDCGEAAVQWSYDNADPREMIGRAGCRYSHDLGHYVARCRTCHIRFDREARIARKAHV